MAELVDALDLGSSTEKCGGSSPPIRTVLKTFAKNSCYKRNNILDVNLEKKNELDAELTIKIKPEDYQEDFEKELKNYRKKVDLPGFRKGKAPLNLLKKRLGSDLKKQLIPDTVNKSLQNYIKENDLKLLLNPLQKDSETEPEWESQDSFEFKYDVGLRPEIDIDLQEKLGDVQKYKIEATDEEVDEQIEKIKNLKGTSDNKEKVEDDETLSIRTSVTELDENQQPLEGGLDKSKAMKLAEIPADLKAELIGKSTNEEVIVNLKSMFEDDEKLAEFLDTDKLTIQDVEGEFKVTIESIFIFQPVEIGEEVYKEVFPDKEINDIEEFKAAIKEALESGYERETDSHLFKEIKDTFIKRFDKGIPEEFLKKWFDKVQEEEEENQQEDKSHEEKYKDFINDIKWMIVVDGLADRFEVKVESQEVMEYAESLIRNEVSRIGMGDIGEEKVKEYASNYLKDQNNYFKSHFTLKEDKVFKHVKENVEFPVKTVTYNEFQKIVNPESEAEQETEKAENNE